MTHRNLDGEGVKEQQEQVEWDTVNRLLQNHGFKPIQFADPMENKNLAELVLLEKLSASEIRHTLKTMVKDSERRQALIQELIQANSQLKDEVKRHTQRVAQLEGILDGVKGKVQGLEDSYIGKAAEQCSQLQQLQQGERDAERCQALEQNLAEEQEVISQLQRKLYVTVKEEERRVARQNSVFQQIHKRSAQPHWQTDQQILDVMDVYEAQIQNLSTELMAHKGDSKGKNGVPPELNRKHHEKSDTFDVSTSNYKALLKSYQEQLKEMKGQRGEMRAEIQLLKQDLESRPTVKELKSYKQQLRRMDRLLQHSNVQTSQLDTVEDDCTDMKETKVENIDRIQAVVCRRYLKLACQELDVHDLSQMTSAVKLKCKQAESTSRLLKELHCALKKLVIRLLPWLPVENTSPAKEVRMEDLLLMVDTLLEETSRSEKGVRSPTNNSLQSMVSHFQKLFDVPSFNGVYPRMNEVYTKLGEMTNTMRNLRDIFDLDDRAPPSEVVNQAARLSTLVRLSDSQDNLLGSNDIDSIIVKLEEHEAFFPAFQSLVLQLLQILGISCLENIVPTVRRLKSRAE